MSNLFGWEYEWLDASEPIELFLPEDLFYDQARVFAATIVSSLPEGFNQERAIKMWTTLRANMLLNIRDNRTEKPNMMEVALKTTLKNSGATEKTILACEGAVSLLIAVEDYEKGRTEEAWVQLLHCHENILTANFHKTDAINLLEKRLFVRSGSDGGKQAGENRAKPRNEVIEKIKEIIRKKYLWNDATQTLQSITNTIWAEIRAAKDSGNDWQGIAHAKLLKGRLGWNTVYIAVQETDTRYR